MDLPVERYLIAQAVAHISIEEVVANVGRGALHPFDRNGSFGDVEIVLHEFRGIRWRFPVKLFRNARPKLGRIVQGLVIEFLVLIEAGYVGISADCRIWIEY